MHTIEAIGREKGLDPEVIIQAMEEAYAAASRKYYKSREDFGARFDRESGVFAVFSRQVVVEDDDVADPMTEIALEDARRLRTDVDLGDVIETEKEGLDVPLTRIAAQAAKQVIYQKVKEAEREVIWAEYHDRAGELLTGQVKRFDRGDMVVDLGRTEGIITRREQSRAEHYNPGDRIRTVLLNVERQGKGPQLILSRASELLVMKLFEMEVPEIYDGTVSIVNVARDAGERSKVAVRSKDRDVDPVGACVGMKGSRVQAVIRELRGEKIDIVQYDDDSNGYVRNALNPAAINRVAVKDFEEREMEVIVAEDQLSLAIGKRGQNVRLAGKLVGWNLDIKSETEKKAEVEAEMERMATASQELGSLPGIAPEISTCLLDAGFRTVEEVSLASMDDLTGIEGIDEETAIGIHDAAEALLEQWAAEAAARAEAGEDDEVAAQNGEDVETTGETADGARAEALAAEVGSSDPALEVEAAPSTAETVEAAGLEDDAEAPPEPATVPETDATTEQPGKTEA
ncbi:MAG: transcription termination factor NusA [Planctomycetota bacterium]|jgi:N utilization substance protein A